MGKTASQCSTPNNPTLSRRTLLKVGLTCIAGLALPLPSFAQLSGPIDRERSLSLYNTHTGESLQSVVYWSSGNYLPEALSEINFLLRDHRTDQIKPMDPKLFDLLNTLSNKLGNRKPFQIISGYRCPETNRKLRQASSRVAKNSFHLTGQAADIRLPGHNLAQLKRAALSLRAGGVGYYPQSNFIHVDTGPRRSW